MFKRTDERSLRAYKAVGGDEDHVWILDKEDLTDYPKLTCPYKDGYCTTRCAFFSTNWRPDNPVYCGNVKIGVLK